METDKEWLLALRRLDLVSCKGDRKCISIGVVEKITPKRIKVCIYQKYISGFGIVCYSKYESVYFSKQNGTNAYWQIAPLEVHRSLAENIIKLADEAHRKIWQSLDANWE